MEMAKPRRDPFLIYLLIVQKQMWGILDSRGTLGGKGTQGQFLIPVKIPAEYVSLMPKLPENAKIKIIYGGTYFSIGFTLGNSLLSWIPLP